MRGAQLALYECHKRVHAAKIESVLVGEDGWIYLKLNGAADLIQVPVEWRDKHQPEPGGYFVMYSDGYESYSPAKAFEEGYRLYVDPRERYRGDPEMHPVSERHDMGG